MISYKCRKVIPIGTVSELTGLSARQIRYYEERKLISPERTKGQTRKYSFEDVDALFEIANKMEDGLQTFEIRKIQEKNRHSSESQKLRETIIKEQINVHFHQQAVPARLK